MGLGEHRPKQCVDLMPVVLSQRRQYLIRWKLRKRSTQTFKRNGKNSVVFKSKTPVRVSERKTKQEKMYARHGKMLAFFPPICYDEITGTPGISGDFQDGGERSNAGGKERF